LVELFLIAKIVRYCRGFFLLGFDTGCLFQFLLRDYPGLGWVSEIDVDHFDRGSDGSLYFLFGYPKIRPCPLGCHDDLVSVTRFFKGRKRVFLAEREIERIFGKKIGFGGKGEMIAS
jgi:hypothetical protein